ncbi:hypothetical protein BDZ91DRAFT_700235 [Kalaharituber pfeilii]|nr:hypothetical protein BDZ91DRAFT_700235 [Kalaharituber pfeilii]
MPHSFPPLRVGYVPEHFSTPLHLLADTILSSLPQPPSVVVQLVPFPSGTGHMITSLDSRTIDVAVGLTEGFIAGLCKPTPPHYRLIGSYVSSPLRWAVSTGSSRKSELVDPETGKLKLKAKKLGVSRIGSGSYVMGYVLADREGWLEDGKEPFEFVVLNDFKGLRDGVNNGVADAFMWEYFTSKKYYETKEITHISDLPTPWPSWHIVAHTSLLPGSTSPHMDPRLPLFLTHLNGAIAHFNTHPDEAVKFISSSTEMHYSEEDARSWLETVQFVKDTREVKMEVVKECVEVLQKAGVVKKGEGLPVEEMVVKVED